MWLAIQQTRMWTQTVTGSGHAPVDSLYKKEQTKKNKIKKKIQI